MNGILLVDKPANWTSFDVVNYVRRLVAQIEGKKPKLIKVGHSGTLDPFATGLLVLMVGKDFTKRASELSKLDKIYEVTMKLGFTSSTGDTEGEIQPSSGIAPSSTELETVLKDQIGQIEQLPPIYSAIKINGERAYKLARAGKQVVMEPRTVTISNIELVSYTYPDARFTAEVSSGTYIRSLVEDIGKLLGTGAYTEELRRLSVGNFRIEQATKIEDIKPDKIADMLIQELNI
jgi:tRNA pseudouridine55 synthase